ncbi:MAG: lectin like domain-containing protein, partial [Methanobrevibacter sp.]|nr:lectin like domain-containing protein [Methanobrevibacter sp.]
GIWYKNVFNSTDDEVLAAFSTYFNEKTNYTAYVYVNGELVNVQEGSAHNGYCTIKLSKYISLKKGDKFEIVLNVHSDRISIIPVYETTSSKRDYALEGVSFFSFDGESWEDLYNYSGEYYENGNRTHWYVPHLMACLKAFTIPKVNTTDIAGFKVFNETYGIGDVVNVPVNASIDFIAMIVDEYGDLVNNGIFKFTINDEEYLIDESNNYTIKFNDIGIYNIIFTELDGLDVYNNFSRTIQLGKLNVAFPTSVSFEDSLLENYSTHLNVNVIDGNGNPVPDGIVSFEILDSQGVSVLNHTSNINDFTFDCYLDPGVYRILFKFTSADEDYHNASLNGKFRVKNLTSLSLSLKNITYGEMENITCVLDIGDVNLTFTVNGSNGYSEVFNSSDSLNLSDLDVGIYDVHVRFNGNEDYAHNSTSGSFVVGQRPSEISYSYAKIYAYPNSEYFIITLMDSVTGNALANKPVQYKFNNGKVATVKTDANGVVKIKISV